MLKELGENGEFDHIYVHCNREKGYDVLIVGVREDVCVGPGVVGIGMGGGSVRGRERADFRRGECRGGAGTPGHPRGE